MEVENAGSVQIILNITVVVEESLEKLWGRKKLLVAFTLPRSPAQSSTGGIRGR